MAEPNSEYVRSGRRHGMIRRHGMMTTPTPRARLAVAGVMTWAVLSAAPTWAQGERLFDDYCASCHGDDTAAENRAPDLDALRQRTPEVILEAMTTGSMAVNAEPLSTDQRQVLAEFLAGRSLASAPSTDVVTLTESLPQHAEWQPAAGADVERVGQGSRELAVPVGRGRRPGRRRRATPHAEVGVRFPNANSPSAQPTVTGGRIYIGSDGGRGLCPGRRERLHLLGLRGTSSGPNRRQHRVQ